MYKALKLKIGQQNCCPFPHTKEDGQQYYETNQSSGIDENGKFNCFVCGRGYTDEIWFTSAYLNCSYEQAKKFNKLLSDSRTFLPSKEKWKKHQEKLMEELNDPDSKITKYVNELGIRDIVEDARLGLYMNRLTIPSFYKGKIINICQFCPGETPKYRNSTTAITGIITTTKRFKSSKDYVLVCAGEKDMMLATKFGFNAVSILGGEKAKPLYNKDLFRGKKVYIAYDNDKAGIDGALDLASWLYRITKDIKVLNVKNVFNEDFGDLTAVAKEDKEDLTDFFVKYNKNEIDLWNVIENTMWYQPPALENSSVLELVKNIEMTMKELRERLKEK